MLLSLKLYCQEQHTGHTFKTHQLNKIYACRSFVSSSLMSATHRNEILGDRQTFLDYITKYIQIKVQLLIGEKSKE